MKYPWYAPYRISNHLHLCLLGRAYLQQCAAGVIFDPKIDACTTPDQSARPECAAGKVLGFECPKYDNEE